MGASIWVGWTSNLGILVVGWVGEGEKGLSCAKLEACVRFGGFLTLDTSNPTTVKRQEHLTSRLCCTA